LFSLKITGTVSPYLASKPVVTVSSDLTSKPDESFPVWTLKPVAWIW
jgi:hypothetical protein